MEILKTISGMQEWSKSKKEESKTICFVPTMGYLHQGHISLMEKGKHLCHELVISIFVNPAQFGPNEDLDTYPSDIENDLALARKAGVTAVFLPGKNTVYPENFQTEIKLQTLPQFLCGKFRPVFFQVLQPLLLNCLILSCLILLYLVKKIISSCKLSANLSWI